MRQIIVSAVPLGYRPDEVRAMIPRDWMLVKRGHEALAEAGQPGQRAPSEAEISDLVERYG